jgi:hypothetical protein
VRVRHWYATCGLVGALTLAGCTGGDDPDPSTTSGSSTTSSTSPSSSATTTTTTAPTVAVSIPPAAKAHTPEGAEAFVRFFVEQSNVASMEADVTILPGLSDPGCLSCTELQKQVEELRAKGHHYRSSPVTVSDVSAITGAPVGQQFVRLRMVQNDVDVVDAVGKVVSSDERASLARTTSVVWTEGRWLVYGIAQ